jgi:hypothetical protein
MGQVYSNFTHINYEELQIKIKTGTSIILLNTLSTDNQNYLIKGTIKAAHEIGIMNDYLKKNKGIEIIIYGKDHYDTSVIKKYNQLKKLGFNNVYIYFGGLFEWALLQDIYGSSNFETDGKIKDPLQISKLKN